VRTEGGSSAAACGRGFAASWFRGLQGQESQPELKDTKKRSALRWLSVPPGYTTTLVSPPIETR
jgi:hypothetical protein